MCGSGRSGQAERRVGVFGIVYLNQPLRVGERCHGEPKRKSRASSNTENAPSRFNCAPRPWPRAKEALASARPAVRSLVQARAACERRTRLRREQRHLASRRRAGRSERLRDWPGERCVEGLHISVRRKSDTTQGAIGVLRRSFDFERERVSPSGDPERPRDLRL